MDKNFKNILKKDKILFEKDGVFYFSAVPGDIKPSQDQNPEDMSRWSEWRKENFNFFKEQLGNSEKGLILADVGAGQSDFKELVSGFNLVSVDFYPYSGINVVCDFSSGLPFQDDALDIILISNVLEHIPEPDKFLKECFRTLKKGGVLLGSVPFMIGVHQRPYDFYRYTDISLKRLFGACGFSEPKIEPVLGEHVLLFSISARLFTNLARKTRFSANSLLNAIAAVFVRVLWKLIRIGFWALGPLFKKAQRDADWPLGYLFKAIKT